jgi:hypothetical protein
VKFSSDHSTIHRGLQCLYILSTLLYSTQEMYREPKVFPVPSKGAAGVPVLGISLSVRISVVGASPLLHISDGNGFILVNLVFFLE